MKKIIRLIITFAIVVYAFWMTYENYSLNMQIAELSKGAEYDIKYINKLADYSKITQIVSKKVFNMDAAAMSDDYVTVKKISEQIKEDVKVQGKLGLELEKLKKERSDYIKTIKYATVVKIDR
jgi:hypothetical protein